MVGVKQKKIMDRAKGFRGGKSKWFRIAKEAVQRSLAYAYRDRKAKKRVFRQLWIARINAAARLHGFSYSQFMNRLKVSEVQIDRKILADIAFDDPQGFKAVADFVRE